MKPLSIFSTSPLAISSHVYKVKLQKIRKIMDSNHYPVILITNLCSKHTSADKACLRATHRQAKYPRSSSQVAEVFQPH